MIPLFSFASFCPGHLFGVFGHCFPALFPPRSLFMEHLVQKHVPCLNQECIFSIHFYVLSVTMLKILKRTKRMLIPAHFQRMPFIDHQGKVTRIDWLHKKKTHRIRPMCPINFWYLVMDMLLKPVCFSSCISIRWHPTRFMHRLWARAGRWIVVDISATRLSFGKILNAIDSQEAMLWTSVPAQGQWA